MARSHHRPKKPHHQPQHAMSTKTKRKGLTVITIFLAVFGMLLGYLIGGVVLLFIGLVAGAAIGFFIGGSIGSGK